jgi:hypothetical protein
MTFIKPIFTHLFTVQRFIFDISFFIYGIYNVENAGKFSFTPFKKSITGLLPKTSRHFGWQISVASLIKLTDLFPQSHDCSCYVSRPILAPPPLWLQKHTDLRAHTTCTHSTDLWHRTRLANITCAWSWRLCGVNPATRLLKHQFLRNSQLLSGLKRISRVPKCIQIDKTYATNCW